MRSRLGNDYVSYRKASEAWTKSAGATWHAYHGALAIFLALVLWLNLAGVAVAASGTPWHTASDTLAGDVLSAWQLWENALEPDTWLQDDQSWVPSGVPWIVAPHPANPGTALAAGSLGLHRTVDGGVTWSHLPDIVAPVIAVAYTSGNPLTVYAGTELDGNYRSEDGGLYWSRINSGLPQDRLGNIAGAVALVADPELSTHLYAATAAAGGLYRSLDGGTTWHLANTGLPDEALLGLAVTGSGSPRLYVATPSGLYLSTDRGAGWSLLGELPIATAQELLLEPGATGTLLLIASDAIYRSTNGGLTWIDLDLPTEMTPIGDAMLVSGPEYTYLFVAGESGPYWQRLTPASPQSPPQTESETELYVAVTGHTIREPFLTFFNALGGVTRFGYPRTDAISEDGKTVQYFQRSRLEIVLADDGERVVQSPLGKALQSGLDIASVSTPEGGDSTQEQYAVDQVFANFYASNNGRDAYGNPIAPAADEEQMNGVTLYTQYFEFARLEHHPGAATTILLGLIGDEYLSQKGWLE